MKGSFSLLDSHISHKETTMTSFTPECRDFLLTGTRTGKLATVRADGRPHIVPIWFDLDGETIIFMTGKETVKAKNMRRDARVSFCVDDENPPYAYVMVDGTAQIIENPDLAVLLDWSTRIGGRYMGAERAEEYGKRNAVPGETLVRITPTRITFLQNVSD
jgi:PPOX class probable F420-dependent enzyme